MSSDHRPMQHHPPPPAHPRALHPRARGRLRRPLVAALAAALTAALTAGLAGCTSSDATPTPTPSPTPSPTSAPAPTSATPTPSPSPTPEPEPTPDPTPVVQGTARGAVVFVQRMGDASLVAGGDPIRVTLTQTEGVVSWFSAPRQRLTGTMRTESMLRLLGWQPSEDGTTAPLPARTPNAFLSTASGTLAMQILRASVRGDGTLVLDIAPIGRAPETTPEFGPGSLVIDGVAGVRSFIRTLSDDLRLRTVVVGRNAQLALVQFLNTEGTILSEYVLTPPEPRIETGQIDAADVTVEAGAVLRLRTPRPRDPGSVTLQGMVSTEGEQVPMNVTLARWTLPRTAAPK